MHTKAAARSTGPLAAGLTQASDHKVLKQKFKKMHYEVYYTIVEIKYCIEQQQHQRQEAGNRILLL